jgi:hypothetical protein
MAFTYIDNIKDGNFVFFLVDLEIGENIEFNVTREGSGNFTLFLFNKRPTESNVNNDKTINENIFTNPSTIAYSLDDNPYINFTAPEPKIYYIEIILVSDGPDTFTLICGRDLTRYYLPIIPGFQLTFLIFVILFSVGFILMIYKKRMKNF